MKILFVLENYYPNVGGVETLFKNLIEELAGKGHQITLVTTQLDPSHPFREEQNNITIFRYPYRNRYAFTFLALFPLLRHTKGVDLVHTTSYNAAFPAFIASKLRRKKIIITFHEVWASLWFKLPYMNAFTRVGHSLFEKMLLKFSFDKMVAVSESTAESLVASGISKDNIEIIYNGIDYSAWQDSTTKSGGGDDYTKPNAFTYTYYGRLGISKGLNLLIKAADIIRMNHPHSQFKMIIPKTPKALYGIVHSKIKTLGLEDHIIMLHELPQDELIKEIKTSHCVVIPSYSEGFCYAAVETSALGVPIISSDQTALKETVTGKCIKMERMDVPSLVRAIEAAMNEEWEMVEPKTFHLEENTKSYVKLYEQLYPLLENT